MNEVVHQMFGLHNGKYYTVDSCDRIVIPMDVEYKKNAIITRLHEEVREAEIDAYFYHTDLTTDCNSERVKYMKEFLLGEKIKNIEHISGNYVIGINYSIFNKDGKVIKSGKSEVDAKWCVPILLSDVKSENILEYRKGIILDGRVVITIPEISRYGIRNAMNQHPYTIRINEIFSVASNGGYKYITETGSQLDSESCSCSEHCEDHANYYIHHHNGLCDANFNSCFITNAKIGTTIIDKVVASAKLEAPPEYECIDLCHILLKGQEYTIKVDQKLKAVVLNLELFMDNYNEVYDMGDITKILEYNSELSEENPDTPDEGYTEDNTTGDVSENEDGSISILL